VVKRKPVHKAARGGGAGAGVLAAGAGGHGGGHGGGGVVVVVIEAAGVVVIEAVTAAATVAIAATGKSSARPVSGADIAWCRFLPLLISVLRVALRPKRALSNSAISSECIDASWTPTGVPVWARA